MFNTSEFTFSSSNVKLKILNFTPDWTGSKNLGDFQKLSVILQLKMDEKTKFKILDNELHTQFLEIYFYV